MPERIMISNTRPPRTPPTILGIGFDEEGIAVVLEEPKGEVEVTLKTE